MWSDLYFHSFESFSTYCILKIQQRSTLMKRWSDFNFLFTNSSLIQWIHLALYFVIKLNLFLRISPPYFSVSYFRLEEMSVNQFKIIFKLFPEKDLNRKSNFLKSKSKWQVMTKFRNISSLGLIFLLLRPESLLYQKLGRPYWHLKSWKALTKRQPFHNMFDGSPEFPAVWLLIPNQRRLPGINKFLVTTMTTKSPCPSADRLVLLELKKSTASQVPLSLVIPVRRKSNYIFIL